MPALSYYFSVITWFALIILPLQTWFVERLLPQLLQTDVRSSVFDLD